MDDKNLYYYLDAVNEDTDDMPDGAWLEMLKDAVSAYNDLHQTRFDPHRTVITYLQTKNEK